MTINEICEILIFVLLGAMLLTIAYLVTIIVIDDIRNEIAFNRKIKAQVARASRLNS